MDTGRSLLRRPLFKPNSLPWQSRAWDFYDASGDLHRGYTTKANTIGKCRLFCAWQGNPDDEPIPLDEALASDDIDTPGLTETVIAQANDALWRVQAQNGGQAKIQRLLSLNLDVPGEGWLLGRDNGGEDDWNVYSVEQVRWQGGGFVLYQTVGGAGKPEPIGPDDVLIRFYREHPRVNLAADSAFRALLDYLEQGHLAAQTITGAMSNRLAGNGLTLLDSRVDVPAPPDLEGDYNVAQGASETLLEAAETAIRDPSSAAGHVPVFFQAEPPEGSKVADMAAHITFEKPLHEATVRYLEWLSRKIIDGADFPPEWALGLGDTSTYANARIVTQEGYLQDVAPTAAIIASGLSTEWVQPTLLEQQVPVMWSARSSCGSTPIRSSPSRTGPSTRVSCSRKARSTGPPTALLPGSMTETHRRSRRRTARSPLSVCRRCCSRG